MWGFSEWFLHVKTFEPSLSRNESHDGGVGVGFQKGIWGCSTESQRLTLSRDLSSDDTIYTLYMALPSHNPCCFFRLLIALVIHFCSYVPSSGLWIPPQVHFADADAPLAAQLALLHRLNALGYQLVNRDENWRHSAPMRTASAMFRCLELTYVYVGGGER